MTAKEDTRPETDSARREPKVCTTCHFYREEVWSGHRMNFWATLGGGPKQYDDNAEYPMNRGDCHRYPTPVRAPGYCGEWQGKLPASAEKT